MAVAPDSAPEVERIPTFLFTDIVGSSRLWELFPDAMPAALQRHEEILAAAISNNNGHVFKRQGDQFCAVFSNSSDEALAAAIAGQQGLVVQTWVDQGLSDPLRVRVAVHCGGASSRDNDYFGPTLSVIARLLQITNGEQILITGTVVSNLKRSLPDEVQLHDLGARRLRDIAATERIYQVAAPGLPTEFAALESLDRRANNLPSPPSRLVGRAEQSELLRQLLLESSARLVTVTGLGGIGKTRLTVHVSSTLLDNFEDGVWFVDLSTVTDPAQAEIAISRTLQLREQSGASVADTVVNWLRQRQALLVLDNCEHMLPGLEPLVVRLLAECRGLKIVATSRRALNVRGERNFVVTPLKTDTPGGEASALLVERVQDIDPQFAINPDNNQAIDQICKRLEGLPLAIELAAPQLAVLGPARMLARLDDRLAVVRGGAYDIPERQRSLFEVISSSYEELDEPEQRLFRRLSLFAGGSTVDAAIAMSHSDDSSDVESSVLAHLTTLMQRSLLTRIPASGESEARFVMLETLREFAVAELMASGVEISARDDHAAWFASVAADAAPRFHGANAAQVFQSLDDDRLNLISALSWLTDRAVAGERNPSQPNPLQLAADLWPYWDRRGYQREARHWLDRTLQLPITADAALRAISLRYLGNCYLFDPTVATGYYQASRDLAIKSGLSAEANRALFGLCHVAVIRGEYELAREICTQFLAQSVANDDQLSVVLGRLWRSLIECDAGNLAEAEQAVNAALALAAEIDAGDYRAWGSLNLGRIARLRGHHDDANRILVEAQGQAELSGDIPLQAFLQRELALNVLPGEPLQARELLSSSLAVALESADDREIVALLEAFAMLLTAEGNYAAAVSLAVATGRWRIARQMPKPHSERERYSEAVAMSRALLSAEQLHEATRHGETLQLSDSCQLAIG